MNAFWKMVQSSLSGFFTKSEELDFRKIYFPLSNSPIFSPDSLIVTGVPGSGKTLLWRLLQSPEYRDHIHQQDTFLLHINKDTICIPGFGEHPDPYYYPSVLDFREIQAERYSSYLIWKTIVLFNLLQEEFASQYCPEFMARTNWESRVIWVKANEAQVSDLIRKTDSFLYRNKNYLFVLFDGVGQLAKDRTDLNQILRGLIKVLLELKETNRIRGKLFLRPDQFDKFQLAETPDVSRSLHSASLDWDYQDIFALFFHLLANHPQGDRFIDLAKEITLTVRKEGRKIIQEQKAHWHFINGVWYSPWEIRRSASHQKDLFAELFPISKAKRSNASTYQWTKKFLQDTQGRYTPSSFLSFVYTFVSRSIQNKDEVIPVSSLLTSLEPSALVRVQELQKRYSWLDTAMTPLKEMSVPFSFPDVEKKWIEAGVLDQIGTDILEGWYSPPKFTDLVGLVKNLEEIGVFYLLSDGQINVPDIYRVHYKLGRKGGVKGQI